MSFMKNIVIALNELISGTVKRFVRGSNLIIDLGKVEAIMPAREYPKTEKYQVGEKVLALLLEVKDTENGGAEVILSRASPEFVRQLLIQEVPEVSDGTIIIDKIVTGSRLSYKIDRSLDRLQNRSCWSLRWNARKSCKKYCAGIAQ